MHGCGTRPTVITEPIRRGGPRRRVNQAGRRARRPLPAGRPAQRERRRPVLAGPRPVLERHVAAARDRRGRRAGRRCCSRPRGARRPCSTGGMLRVLDAERGDGVLLRRQRVGLRHLPRHPARHRRTAGAARAAWLVSEVADSIADRPRAAGSPTAGWSRRTCWSTTAARSGSSASASTPPCAACPPGRVATDVTDLGGLLYCRAHRRWAGDSASGGAGRAARPRPGAAAAPGPRRRPASLDDLCDERPQPHTRHSTATCATSATSPAHAGSDAFLGDFVGGRPPGWPTTVARRRNPDRSETVTAAVRRRTSWPVPDDVGDAARSTPAGRPRRTSPSPTRRRPPRRTDRPPSRRPGRPAHPGGDADLRRRRRRRVLAGRARATRRPRPRRSRSPPSDRCSPPTPATAHRPAAPRSRATARPAAPTTGPGTSTGRPVRRATGSGMIPATRRRRRRRRAACRAAAGSGSARWSALALLLVLAVVVAFNLGRGQTPLGSEPDAESTRDGHLADRVGARPAAGRARRPPTTSTRRATRPRRTRTLAPLAVDGDPDTRGRPRPTTSSSGPAGLKTGVGLVLDLGESQEVAEVDARPRSARRPSSPPTSPTSRRGRRRADRRRPRAPPGRRWIALERPATGRYLVSGSPRCPSAAAGFRGEVAEVAVLAHDRRSTASSATSPPTPSCSRPTSPATPTRSASCSPGTATGCGRWRCAPPATPTTPPTVCRTAWSRRTGGLRRSAATRR